MYNVRTRVFRTTAVVGCFLFVLTAPLSAAPKSRGPGSRSRGPLNGSVRRRTSPGQAARRLARTGARSTTDLRAHSHAAGASSETRRQLPGPDAPARRLDQASVQDTFQRQTDPVPAPPRPTGATGNPTGAAARQAGANLDLGRILSANPRSRWGFTSLQSGAGAQGGLNSGPESSHAEVKGFAGVDAGGGVGIKTPLGRSGVDASVSGSVSGHARSEFSSTRDGFRIGTSVGASAPGYTVSAGHQVRSAQGSGVAVNGAYYGGKPTVGVQTSLERRNQVTTVGLGADLGSYGGRGTVAVHDRDLQNGLRQAGRATRFVPGSQAVFNAAAEGVPDYMRYATQNVNTVYKGSQAVGDAVGTVGYNAYQKLKGLWPF